MCILTTTAYVLCLWFVIPLNHELTCGQSVFSIAVTLAYIVLIFFMISGRNRTNLTESLHMVTKIIYKDVPSIRIAIVVSRTMWSFLDIFPTLNHIPQFQTFIFQLLAVALNVLSMAMVVSVLQESTGLANSLLAGIYTFFFMILEGWLFLIFMACNKFATGYCVGLWYMAK